MTCPYFKVRNDPVVFNFWKKMQQVPKMPLAEFIEELNKLTPAQRKKLSYETIKRKRIDPDAPAAKKKSEPVVMPSKVIQKAMLADWEDGMKKIDLTNKYHIKNSYVLNKILQLIGAF